MAVFDLGVTIRMWGVRDPEMLIKIKRKLHGLFLHQNTPFKFLGEKHMGKKFFLNHPIEHAPTNVPASVSMHLRSYQLVRACINE